MPPGQKLITELKVSGHLMSLDTGLFCIVQTPASRRADDGTGLPGVRISLPPGGPSRPDAVSIVAFRPDGWLNGQADAALVRVTAGPAQVLVTVYQAPSGTDTAPRLQVLRLADDAQGVPAAAPVGAAAAQPGRAAPGGQPRTMPEMVAHVQVRGDVGAALGDWIGERGSKRWIEGFMLLPQKHVTPRDIEYQAVLGRGWLSPWVEGGQLCGSRGMALPILGMRVRLRGGAAQSFDCRYSATFVDGTEIGPVGAGEPCEAESLAPMEAFQLLLTPRGQAGAAAQSAGQEPRAAARGKPPAKAEPKGRGAPAKPGGRRGR
ncbi:MAG: hypothetical protein JO209_02220 [Acidisphaera sp.]|nr:hypothetical protein [Acidisphaera sp.]